MEKVDRAQSCLSPDSGGSSKDGETGVPVLKQRLDAFQCLEVAKLGL